MDEHAPPDEAVRVEAVDTLEQWLAGLEVNPVVAAVVRDDDGDNDRWFVRVTGVSKDVFSIWFELSQRTLRVESYVLPAPEENHGLFYEQLLRRNHGLRDVAFSIGEEAAVFLACRVDVRRIDVETLDRVLGEIYETVERSFQSALRVGFASRFQP